MKMNVTVELPEWNGEYGDGPANEIISECARQVLEQLGDGLKEKAEAAISAAINAKMTALIEAACDEAVQPTDEFGHPTGEKTDLRSVLLERAKSAMTYVDRERYRYGDQKTKVQEVIEAAVKSIVDRELQREIDEAKGKLREQVKSALIERMGVGVIEALKAIK